MNIDKHFSVIPLSSSNYRQALSVALTIFKSDPNSKEWIPNLYQKAVFPDRYMGEVNTYVYWILWDNAAKRIIGVTGLYTQNKDKKYCFWLGWLGIVEEYRGRSLGKYLFEWTQQEAMRRNKLYLRLQTSNLHYATTAVALYKKQGCREIKRQQEKLKHSSYYSIFMEKKLV
jgi:GNAT superfamily N-acetyltransferase